MEYVIEPEDAGQRIDAYLARRHGLHELSRSHIQKLIASGDITVNNNPVKSNYKLRQGDTAVVNVPEPDTAEILPENIELSVLYEDNEVIVINKPRGMVVHPAPGHYEGTLVNALMYHCGSSLSGINGYLRPGIVHRIDKDTSGVIIAAKTDLSHRRLSEQLAAHTIVRKYAAIVYNNFAEDSGTVNKPIARHPSDRKKMAVVSGGRHAVTHYRVLERYGKYTYIEAILETGRTHQIRVHMSHIGHPLLGDTVYGNGKQFMNFNGQILHARVLGFVHPVTGEYMEFEAPLPDYFIKVRLAVRAAD